MITPIGEGAHRRGLARKPGRKRVQDRKLDDEMRLHDGGHVEPVGGPQIEPGLADERRDGSHDVHGKDDPQDRAEIAQVRQFEAYGVLPYNRLHNETGMQASCRNK